MVVHIHRIPHITLSFYSVQSFWMLNCHPHRFKARDEIPPSFLEIESSSRLSKLTIEFALVSERIKISSASIKYCHEYLTVSKTLTHSMWSLNAIDRVRLGLWLPHPLLIDCICHPNHKHKPTLQIHLSLGLINVTIYLITT